MTAPLDLDQLRADMEAGTPGPWVYRPHQYTDWGEVYAGTFRICQARDPNAMGDACLSKHRQARTDPWGANARLIAQTPALAARVLSDAARLAAADALAEVSRATVDSMCEGFCSNLPSRETFHPDMSTDCSVCHLRAALAAYRATEGKP